MSQEVASFSFEPFWKKRQREKAQRDRIQIEIQRRNGWRKRVDLPFGQKVHKVPTTTPEDLEKLREIIRSNHSS